MYNILDDICGGQRTCLSQTSRCSHTSMAQSCDGECTLGTDYIREELCHFVEADVDLRCYMFMRCEKLDR